MKRLRLHAGLKRSHPIQQLGCRSLAGHWEDEPSIRYPNAGTILNQFTSNE
jgi:hypothetical protein